MTTSPTDAEAELMWSVDAGRRLLAMGGHNVAEDSAILINDSEPPSRADLPDRVEDLLQAAAFDGVDVLAVCVFAVAQAADEDSDGDHGALSGRWMVRLGGRVPQGFEAAARRVLDESGPRDVAAYVNALSPLLALAQSLGMNQWQLALIAVWQLQSVQGGAHQAALGRRNGSAWQ